MISQISKCHEKVFTFNYSKKNNLTYLLPINIGLIFSNSSKSLMSDVIYCTKNLSEFIISLKKLKNSFYNFLNSNKK